MSWGGKDRISTFISRHFEGFLIILILIGVLCIAVLVRYEMSFLNFFFLPVILAAYFLGKNRGVLTSVLCVLMVLLYMIFPSITSGNKIDISFDEMINLISWGGFLILTGALVGTVSEQRENKLKKLRGAYIGVLDIMFKYLECADDTQPASLRIANLAGNIAAAAGLETHEIENIKSAALLSSSGDLSSNLSFFIEMTDFLHADIKPADEPLTDREKVMLKATASLLNEVAPLLSNYYLHYVREADKLDKDLPEIPIGSSILALAHIHDKIISQAPQFQGVEAYSSLTSVQGLSGRTFHPTSIAALFLVITSP